MTRKIVLLVAGSVAPASLSAQTLVETGVLIVHHGGSMVAREDFEIHRGSAGGGFTIRTSTRYGEDPNRAQMSAVIEFDADSQPAAAQFDHTGSVVRRTLATIGARRVTVRAVSPATSNAGETESFGEYRRERPLVVLADSLFGVFAIPPRVTTVPQHGLTMSGEFRSEIAIVEHGFEAVAVDGRSMRLRHIAIAGSGIDIHLWYDGRSLMRAAIPGTDLVATRVRSPDNR